MADADKISLEVKLPEGTVTATGTEAFVTAIRSAIGPVITGLPVPNVPPHHTPRTVQTVPDASLPPNTNTTDIRSLKDQKQPKSAVEMAAIVAYYISELAQGDERKTSIGTAEITRYFGQAGYRSNSEPRHVLTNAKTAGYFDSAGRGQYKLNPVGYNLVTAQLPDRGSKQ
jgi:hypothetical protein